MGISYFDPHVSGRNRVRNPPTTGKNINGGREKLFSDGCSILTCRNPHDIEWHGIRGAALQIVNKKRGKDCP